MMPLRSASGAGGEPATAELQAPDGWVSVPLDALRIMLTDGYSDEAYEDAIERLEACYRKAVMMSGETAPAQPWCPDHGYGCEPTDCPCGHSLRCDCNGIANEV